MVVVYDSVVIFRIYRKVSCTSGLCSKIDFSYPEQRLSACTVNLYSALGLPVHETFR